MSYIWSVQFINFKSCARHGFRDFLMLRLILTFLFASFAFFLEAQSVLYGSAKPVLTKDLNIKEAFPHSFFPYIGAEVEFWRIYEDTPQDNIDNVSIHVIKKGNYNKKINNKDIKYKSDVNIRYTLDSLCIVHDVTVSETYTEVLTESELYYWIGSSEIWFTNFKAGNHVSKEYVNKSKNRFKHQFVKSADRLAISKELFNWMKTKFPDLKIKEERDVHTLSDLVDRIGKK